MVSIRTWSALFIRSLRTLCFTSSIHRINGITSWELHDTFRSTSYTILLKNSTRTHILLLSIASWGWPTPVSLLITGILSAWITISVIVKTTPEVSFFSCSSSFFFTKAETISMSVPRSLPYARRVLSPISSYQKSRMSAAFEDILK